MTDRLSAVDAYLADQEHAAWEDARVAQAAATRLYSIIARDPNAAAVLARSVASFSLSVAGRLEAIAAFRAGAAAADRDGERPSASELLAADLGTDAVPPSIPGGRARRYQVDGEILTVAEMAARAQTSRQTIRYRLSVGMKPCEAMAVRSLRGGNDASRARKIAAALAT